MTVVEVSLMFYQFVFALFSPLSRGVTVHNIEEVVELSLSSAVQTELNESS